MHSTRGKILLLIAIIGLLAGCGYHRQETEVQLPSWIRTIYIAPWKNNSTELRLGQWLTDDLREEFLRDSGLSLVPRDQADVILEGKIESAYTTGLSYVRYDVSVERRIGVECSVRLLDAKTGKELWKSPPIYREEGFYVGKTLMMTEGYKENALKKISQDLAEIIHHRIAGVY